MRNVHHSVGFLRDPRPISAALVALIALSLAGCASIGPSMIKRDRVNYQEVLTESWKSQVLLNIVRIRYADPPFFLDVGSIVNSYSWEAGANLGGTFGASSADTTTLGATGRYTDRPTITYSPITGDKFTKSIMTPLAPAAILSFAQAGYPVDLLFRLCVRAVNGVYNRSAAYALRRPSDPAFDTVIETLRRLQNTAAFGMRIEKRAGDLTAVLFLRRGGGEVLEADLKRLTQALGLQADAEEYLLSFGDIPRDEKEIAVLSRSMLEIMGELAAYVDVPQTDVDEARVSPAPEFGSRTEEEVQTLVRVKSGAQRPSDAFVAAQYRGKWFWIEDRDLRSKRIFSFVMLLFSLAESGGVPSAPLLTIPAGP
jgi:hypothetical protein